MASYEYRCRTCEDVFEVRRAMSAPATATLCPAGHDDTTRVFSAVSVTGLGGQQLQPVGAPGGSCCGGGCCS